MAIGGRQYADKIRQMDKALTQVLENPYGKILGYYPPVYVASKCFELARPYYLELQDESGYEKGFNWNNMFNKQGKMENAGNSKPETYEIASSLKKQNVEVAPEKKKFNWNNLFNKQDKVDNVDHENSTGNSTLETHEKASSLKKQNEEGSPDKKRKSLNWFFGGTETETETKTETKTETETEPKKDTLDTPTIQVIGSADDLYYPCEGSDIDEDDDSDVEGEYTFYNDSDDDVKSIGAGSIRSVKEMIEMNEKELKSKLVENFVYDNTKEETKAKKRGSIKRIFSRNKN